MDNFAEKFLPEIHFLIHDKESNETRIAKISTKDASNFVIFRDRVMRTWPINADETLF